MQTITVTPLSAQQIGIAYPLIRESIPTLSLPHWYRYARQRTNPRAAPRMGILVAAETRMPFPSGLVCYRRDIDLTYGDILIGEHLVALGLGAPQGVLDGLITAMEQLGASFGCRMVRPILRRTIGPVAQLLYASGYYPEGVSFCKTLANDPIADDARMVPMRMS